MDAIRFDRLTRRFLLGGFAAALDLGTARFPDVAIAKKRKKVKRNAFGCVNVGKFCKNAGQCCSGICRGRKGGKKCRAHDSGVGCQVGAREEECGGTDISCTSATGAPGVCDTTTGNAAYCHGSGLTCATCSKDEDCQELCQLATAVCIKCPDCDGSAFQTACVGPSPGDCI
jgi:hypothetical protein